MEKTKADIDKDTYNVLSKFVSTDETRYYFNLVRVEKEEGKYIAVATDGRRLIKKVISWNLVEGSYVLMKSRKGYHLVKEDDEKVGRFPNWRQAVPTFSNDCIKVEQFDTKMNFAMLINKLVDSEKKFLCINPDHYRDIPNDVYTVMVERGKEWHFYTDKKLIEIVIVQFFTMVGK